jgi:hypothetical protein
LFLQFSARLLLVLLQNLGGKNLQDDLFRALRTPFQTSPLCVTVMCVADKTTAITGVDKGDMVRCRLFVN